MLLNAASHPQPRPDRPLWTRKLLDRTLVTIAETETIEEAFRRLNINMLGILFAEDAGGRVVGAVTDGDIRRKLLGGASHSRAGGDLRQPQFCLGARRRTARADPQAARSTRPCRSDPRCRRTPGRRLQPRPVPDSTRRARCSRGRVRRCGSVFPAAAPTSPITSSTMTAAPSSTRRSRCMPMRPCAGATTRASGSIRMISAAPSKPKTWRRSATTAIWR